MDYGRQTSYQKALQNTFNTTYKISYPTVDTYHRSPVYTERNYYSVPQERLPQYPRKSYPYQRDYSDQNEPVVDHRHQNRPYGFWRGYYDYESDQDPRFRPPPINANEPVNFRQPLTVDKTYYDKDVNTMPIENKSFKSWQDRGGEPISEVTHPKDSVEKRYNEILANPEDLNDEHHNRPFCHGCFSTNECVNQLGCHHRFCDTCFNKLHCTDNPFRYTTCLHYFCSICKDKTPESKIIRFDPYDRRLEYCQHYSDCRECYFTHSGF